MVYLLKMGGSFHGYVSHNQMVNVGRASIAPAHGFLQGAIPSHVGYVGGHHKTRAHNPWKKPINIEVDIRTVRDTNIKPCITL